MLFSWCRVQGCCGAALREQRGVFAPARTKPGSILEILLNCSLCLWSITGAFIAFLLKDTRAGISGISVVCIVHYLPGTATALERHRHQGLDLEMSTKKLVCCQPLVPCAGLLTNTEYMIVAFGERSSYKLSPRHLLIVFFHKLYSLALLSCFKI